MATLLALMAGYSLGRLPDDGTAWSAVHLVIAVTFFVAAVRVLRRDIGHASGSSER